MGIHDLTMEIESLNREVENNGGEMTPEMEQRLFELERFSGPICDKMCAWILDMDAEEARVETFEKFYKHKKKVLVNLRDRIKGKVIDVMKALGKDRLKGTYTATVRQASRPRIFWVGEKEIPKKFTRTEVKPDGDMIYKLWREGTLPMAKKTKDGGMTDGFRAEYTDWLDVR